MMGPVRAPGQWALLVGINQYPALHSWYQLQGCINDVQLMASILRDTFSFPQDRITILEDVQATRDGILAALERLARSAGEGDIVVVHYSGHGSQMTDRERDEADGLDETIVPHDSGRAPHPNRDITDDEIHEWLVRLAQKTPHITLIFDCCHSGTVSRAAFGSQARWVEPDLRPRSELPASPLAAAPSAGLRRDVGPSGWLPLSQGYVLIAGCRDEESAYEHVVRQGASVVPHGALTFYLAQELARAFPGATYRDVFERTSALVTAHYPRQRPQLEGARDRVLFGVRESRPLRFVPVYERLGGSVVLGAGAAHGLTVGSRWAIRAQAAAPAAGLAGEAGLVEISEVFATRSAAAILREAQPGAIAAGARAVEEAHSHGEMRFVVQVQAPAQYAAAAEELRGLVSESDLLRLAREGEGADACAWLIAPRRAAGSPDPVPQMGAVAEATWAVVGQDGKLMLPCRRAAQAGAAAAVRENLEKVARYRQALALRNPNEDSPLKGKVELVLKTRSAQGDWAEARSHDEGGRLILEEGECVALEIANRHAQPIYVSVLDFGLTGGISLLHPTAGPSEQLAPGRSIQVGARVGDEIRLYMPDSFPYLPDPGDRDSLGGIETFKLFATTREANFHLLLQEGYRSGERREPRALASPLERLLTMALTGRGERDIRPTQSRAGEEWITLERSFVLRARRARLQGGRRFGGGPGAWR